MRVQEREDIAWNPRDLRRHYDRVHERLSRPPNAVPDPGICLRRIVISPPMQFTPEAPVHHRAKKRSAENDCKIAKIRMIVAHHYNVSVDDLTFSSERRIVKFRAVAMYLCRHILGASYRHIAEYFGECVEQTVTNNINKIMILSKISEPAKQELNELHARAMAA